MFRVLLTRSPQTQLLFLNRSVISQSGAWLWRITLIRKKQVRLGVHASVHFSYLPQMAEVN